MKNQTTQSGRAIEQVRRRLQWARVGVRVYRWWLVVGLGLCALVVVSKMTGWGAGAVNWWLVGLSAGVAVLCGMLIGGKVDAEAGARQLDAHLGTKDLFLTASTLDERQVAFAPLVKRDAEMQAGEVRVGEVVRYAGGGRGVKAGALCLAVCGLMVLLPDMDVFGTQEQVEKKEQQRKTLVKQEKEIEKRKAVLLKAGVKKPNSNKVERKLDEMKRTMLQLRKQDKLGNQKQLASMQMEMGKQWKQIQMQRAQRGPRQMGGTQRFGGQLDPRLMEMGQQLMAGKPMALSKEMNNMRKLAKQIREEKDPAKQQEMKAALKKKLEAMQQMLKKQNAMSPGLQQALKQAMDNLETSQQQGMSDQAMKNVMQAMALSEMQMQQLAQNMRDMQALEQAMQAAAMAQQLNANHPIDGQKMGGKPGQMQGLSEMKQWCESQLGLCKSGQCSGGSKCPGAGALAGQMPGTGAGMGMGGPGQGRGNQAKYNPDAQTGFKTEFSKSQMQAGRILMKIKTKEIAPEGEVETDYADALSTVQQQVSEAITRQDIPPGYADSVRDYVREMVREVQADDAGE